MHRLLDIPIFYNGAQLLFAPGADSGLKKIIQALAERMPSPETVLDVGCGPSSWLWKLGWQPVGIDISYSYSAAFSANGELAVNASCVALPFGDQSFNCVWNIGVLHHLDDTDARRTILEMVRVCRPDGHIVILDAVLPEPAWKRPAAFLIRRMDRGKFMRTQEQLESLLPQSLRRSSSRHTYAYTGLEILASVCQCGS